MTIYRLETLFPDQLDARIAANPTVVLSFGTLEWHSFHLPLGLDGLVAQALGEQIADRLDAVLAPVSYWAAGGVPYPYTLKFTAPVIEPLLVAIYDGFAEMGFRTIVAITGHFGLEQTLILKRAALTVMERSPVTILPLTEYDLVTDAYVGDHAGIGETSLMWALRPDLIRLDTVTPDTPLDGVQGADPRGQASRERGETLLRLIADRSADAARRAESESALQRAKYVDALGIGVRVLARTFEQRQQLPKSAVPSVTTPAYIAFCQALAQGNYADAKRHAERKLANLAE
ncbi:MAG TPA: creatininase family protein [Phototrophicaceae bacterium]|nr:creatininase family protein [Phototrophicaceae bacterium]